MKFKDGLFSILFCSLIFFSSSNVYAQRSLILDNFDARDYLGKVYLNWTISSGSTCNGIQIYRSIDKINYEKIGDIPGVCGNNSTAQAYSFIDENPIKNKFNYYFIQLGGNGNSEVLTVQIIDLKSNGYKVSPNPVVGESKIYFSNNKNSYFQLTLFNQFGVNVKIVETMSDYFELDSSLLPSGYYFFSIANGELEERTKGGLIIAH